MKLLLILFLTFGSAQTVPHASRQWHAATFRGLTVGKSRRANMLRVLGQPKWSRTSPQEAADESRQVVWNNYERAGEFPGITTVVVDKRSGIITRINFYPAKLSKEQAIAHFGSGYIITRYDFDSCLGDEESEPIYESLNGPLINVEYRARGIAMSIGFNDLVTKISYVSGPIGGLKSKCKQSEAEALQLPSLNLSLPPQILLLTLGSSTCYLI